MSKLRSLILIGTVAAALAGRAHGSLIVAVEVVGPGGVTVRQFATDENVPGVMLGYTQVLDITPGQIGVLSLGDFTPIPGFTVSGRVQTQTIASGLRDLSSLTITNDPPGDAFSQATVYGVDYRGSATQAFSSASIQWENTLSASILAGWFPDANSIASSGIFPRVVNRGQAELKPIEHNLEPSSIVLIGIGLLGFLGYRRWGGA